MKSNKKKLAFYYAIQQIKHTTKKITDRQSKLI